MALLTPLSPPVSKPFPTEPFLNFRYVSTILRQSVTHNQKMRQNCAVIFDKLWPNLITTFVESNQRQWIAQSKSDLNPRKFSVLRNRSSFTWDQ